jgi:hypothetical protein
VAALTEKCLTQTGVWTEWTAIYDPCARIYRPSFEHENARFRENMPKTLVFNLTRTQRRRFQLVLDEIDLRVVFKYWDCVKDEISWFSPSPHPPPPPLLVADNFYSVQVLQINVVFAKIFLRCREPKKHFTGNWKFIILFYLPGTNIITRKFYLPCVCRLNDHVCELMN